MHRYAILDVFTDVPLQGNPLAVFIDGSGLSDDLMQRAARELHLSETVFLLAPAHGADARIRIFTPATELPFAGHPVLGAAFLVGEEIEAPFVRLQTAAGVIPVSLSRKREKVVSGEMEQPIPSPESFGGQGQLLRALGVKRSELPIEAYRNGPRHVFVRLPTEEAVAELRPNMLALERLGALGVSCFAGGESSFKTRMFAPALGVPEDPATGSAAGPLGLHLARHGVIDYGQEIEIRQGAEIGRPSLLRARVEGSAERIDRVIVGGSAVVVARGEYRLQ